ncbi:MAG: serine hydrolase, partial [Geminicoccaceae bacterium]
AKYLPEEVTLPERDGRAISLKDLATHMSGLPRLPDNLSPADHNNPYADYSIEQLYGFLSEHRLTRKIGEQYEYSNLGYGLLGHTLALRMGKRYEALVHDRILDPLGMNSTGINLTPDIEARLAKGHNQVLEVVSNWDLPTLSGAGALRSTVNDLLNFLEMLLGQRTLPLASGVEVALDWVAVKSGKDQEMVWHNGATGGYHSFIGFLPKTKVGVVVLSNASTDIDDIGEHLLNPELPLVPPPKERKVAAIDPDLYDGYIGRYQLETNFFLTITREGDRLFAQATGQQKAEIFPEGERDFFYTVVDAQVTFEVDDKGRAIQLALHQNGRVTLGPRINN